MKKIIGVLLLSCLSFFTVPMYAQRTGGTVKDISQSTNGSIEISAVDNRIIVANAPVKSKMEIYSIVGTKIKEIEIKQSSGEYNIMLPKGYYIVRIAETVRKIVIR